MTPQVDNGDQARMVWSHGPGQPDQYPSARYGAVSGCRRWTQAGHLPMVRPHRGSSSVRLPLEVGAGGQAAVQPAQG